MYIQCQALQGCFLTVGAGGPEAEPSLTLCMASQASAWKPDFREEPCPVEMGPSGAFPPVFKGGKDQTEGSIRGHLAHAALLR